MMNFRSHPNMTKCVTPDGIKLSNNDFTNCFNAMNKMTSVSLSNSSDYDNVSKSFDSESSADVQTVDYSVLGEGEHYIYIKYIKDGSAASGNDSLQFKVRFE